MFAKLADEMVRRFVPEENETNENGENSSNGDSKVGPAPKCHYDEQRGIVLRYLMGPQAGKEYVIAPATLRRASRDALSGK